MSLKDYMFKKRYFHYSYSVLVDKDDFIKKIQNNKRYVVYKKDNDDRIVIYDTLQNYDIDFIGFISSIDRPLIGNFTKVSGYFSHKVSLLEWIGFLFVSTLWWIWFFRNFTFSISNTLWIVVGVLFTFFLFYIIPMASFVSFMRVGFKSRWILK